MDNGVLYTRKLIKPKTQYKKRIDKTCYNCSKPGHFGAKCPMNSGKGKLNTLWSSFAIGDANAESWYFDSGATCHMAKPNQNFTDETKLEQVIWTANNGGMIAMGKGTVELKQNNVNVHEVLKVPDLVTNLLSVSEICKKGHTVIFTAEKCEVKDANGKIIVSGKQEKGLYRVIQPERRFITMNCGIGDLDTLIIKVCKS